MKYRWILVFWNNEAKNDKLIKTDKNWKYQLMLMKNEKYQWILAKKWNIDENW